MSPIRVCQLTASLSPGGMEMRIARLLGRLPQDRFQLAWFAFRDAEIGALVDPGPRVQRALFNKSQRPGVDLPLIKQIAEELRRFRPDILHVHNWATSVYGILAAQLAGVPHVIYGIGGRDSPEPASARQLAVMRTLAPQVDHFTTVCRFLADETARDWQIPIGQISVIPSGVDVEAIDRGAPGRAEMRARFGIPEDALVVGALGTIRAVKRPGDLLEAVGLLAANEKLHLLLVGAPREIDPEGLRARARALGFGDRIHLPGLVGDPAAAVHAFDIVVNCSIFEGASNAILEAMSARVPVVATAVGGSPELVVEGETGFLVPAEDPRTLAAAISALISDPERRRAFGARGRALVLRDRSVEAMVDGHLGLYEEIASRPVQRAGERAAGGARGLVRGVEALWSRWVSVAVAPRPPPG